MHDGGPEPEEDLSDFFAFWTGDEADDLGGVCEESGLIDEGAPERVERIWIDRDVESDLRPLVAKLLGSG